MHLSADAVNGLGVTGFGTVARLEHGDQPVTTAMIADWAGRTDTAITVKPVLDLADHTAVDAYEIPDRLKAQIQALHPTCVFPHCTRPARSCDCDHITPHATGGVTCTCNVAPLCRRHHRLKTHVSWSYRPLEPGIFLWTSPHGHHYLRTTTGTTDLRDTTRHQTGCVHERPPETDPPETDPPEDGPPDNPWRQRILHHIEEAATRNDPRIGWPFLDHDFDHTLEPPPWEEPEATRARVEPRPPPF